jgi:hypothetical protein
MRRYTKQEKCNKSEEDLIGFDVGFSRAQQELMTETLKLCVPTVPAKNVRIIWKSSSQFSILKMTLLPWTKPSSIGDQRHAHTYQEIIRIIHYATADPPIPPPAMYVIRLVICQTASRRLYFAFVCVRTYYSGVFNANKSNPQRTGRRYMKSSLCW